MRRRIAVTVITIAVHARTQRQWKSTTVFDLIIVHDMVSQSMPGYAVLSTFRYGIFVVKSSQSKICVFDLLQYKKRLLIPWGN